MSPYEQLSVIKQHQFYKISCKYNPCVLIVSTGHAYMHIA